MEVVSTNTGNLSAHYNGYAYHLSRTKKDGTAVWYCSKRKSLKCPGKLESKDGDILSTSDHLCGAPDFERLEVRKRIQNAKKRAREENTPIRNIFMAELGELQNKGYNFGAEMPNELSTKRILYHHRYKSKGSVKEPSNREEIDSNREQLREMAGKEGIPSVALDAVLKKSSCLPMDRELVKGYDFNDGIDYHALLQSYKTSGFQATNFGLAVVEINKMIACREKPLLQEDSLETDSFIKRKTHCTIFLGYTSNMASAGIRDTIRFLVQHKMVDCIVTSAGGVEEDLIKCLAPTILGDFALDGAQLRDKGLNRIGNLLVPNENYCLFEEWVIPILDELLQEQLEKKTIWSPSKIITRLGEKIANPDSICYWAAKNEIPIFSPALTDGSLGDMLYFHSYRNPGLVVDIVQDIRRINSIAVKAENSGMIIIGGGVVKHHICNSNLMRNGADYSVYINTANEFDGSDSGARPDEAVSWGKIKKTATPVKVYADATLVFPLIVAETFAAKFHNETNHV